MICCLWVAKLRQKLKLLPKTVNIELRFKNHHFKKCQSGQSYSTVVLHLGKKGKRASPHRKVMAKKKPESKA